MKQMRPLSFVQEGVIHSLVVVLVFGPKIQIVLMRLSTNVQSHLFQVT